MVSYCSLFLLLLIAVGPVQAQGPDSFFETVNLRKDSSISSFLSSTPYYRKRRGTLYGQNGIVFKVLQINRLDLNQARKLSKSYEFKVPKYYLEHSDLRDAKEQEYEFATNTSEGTEKSKKPDPLTRDSDQIINSDSPLTLKPFIFATYRSLEAKNKGVVKDTSEGALRIGTNISSKYYTSQFFYETGKTFSRIDLGAMKIISPNLHLGMRLMFASAQFKDSGATAKIVSTNAFVQATGKHQVKNGFVFSLTGAGTIQGSVLAHLDVSRSWTINKKLKISPTIGYEYLNLRSPDTRLNSASFLAGVFAEFPF